MDESNVSQEWVIWFTKEWLEMQKLFGIDEYTWIKEL